MLTANSWPYQLTTAGYNGARGAESVAARLNWAIAAMNADPTLLLAPITASVAPDTHTVQPTTQSSGLWPPWLKILRDAAANGVLWVENVPGAAPTAGGSWVIHYDVWQEVQPRTLNPAQVVAGTVWNQGNGTTYTQVLWAGTERVERGHHRVADGAELHPGGDLPDRRHAPVGEHRNERGAQLGTVTSTATAIFNAYATTVPYVDTITMLSGDRTTPLGAASTPWDPTAHVYRPNDRIDWARVPGQPVESVPRAVVGPHPQRPIVETTHTLARYVAPTALP